MPLAAGEQFSGGLVRDADGRVVVSLDAGTIDIGKVDQGTGGSSAWKVDGSAVTQPVSGSVSVSNLPGTQPVSGTVTANAGTGTFVVDASGHTIPVSGAFFQATQPVSAASLPLPAGAAQDGTDGAAPPSIPGTGIRGWLRSIYDKLNGTLTTSVSNFPATQPVSGSVSVSNFPATQPVSAASLPLPAGAATDASLTNGNQRTGTTAASVTVGQATSNTTPAQLNAGSIVSTNGVLVQAISTNAASVFIGGSGVTTTTGFELQAGQATPFTVANINTLYAIGTNNTDKVCWSVL